MYSHKNFTIETLNYTELFDMFECLIAVLFLNAYNCMPY